MNTKQRKPSPEYEQTKKMDLDDIETEMENIAMDQDISRVFINSQRMEMLEKVANFKIKKMQLQLEKERDTTQNGIITVNFTSSNTSAQQERIESLDKQVREAKGKNNDA